MLVFIFKLPVILLIFLYVECQRRIFNGKPGNKSFVVYLVWDLSNETLNEQYDTTTICGGILILPNAVLSSGACLKMFEIQYAIAGYNRYVPGGEGRDDKEKECLELAKRPIIEKCYYKDYDLERWTVNDISVARLETSYNILDKSFITKCSYMPTLALMKFDHFKNTTNMNVVVYGWGSEYYHRPDNDPYDLNQEFLRYTSTKIYDLNACLKIYSTATAHGSLCTARYCTEGEGTLDTHGKPLFRRANTNNNTDHEPSHVFDVSNVKDNETIETLMRLGMSARRNGPCQNDHGGPLVAWDNGVEVVIGIVNGYLVNNKMECVGPYLYRSFTQCREFVKCHIEKWKNK